MRGLTELEHHERDISTPCCFYDGRSHKGLEWPHVESCTPGFGLCLPPAANAVGRVGDRPDMTASAEASSALGTTGEAAAGCSWLYAHLREPQAPASCLAYLAKGAACWHAGTLSGECGTGWT